MELEIFKTLYGYDNFRIIDGKPSKEMVDYLKENGYRWSKKNNCWYPATEDAKKLNRYDNFATEFQKKFFTQKLTEQEETRPQSMIEKLIDNVTNYKLNKESLTNFANYIEKNITKEQTAKLEKSIENLKAQLKLRDEKITQLEKSLKITNEQNDDYIHSEEFISKFGDWEKANRIENLKRSESLQISGKIIIHGKDETSYINELRNNPSRENLRKLTNIVSDFGKEMLQNLRLEQNLDNYASPILAINDDGKKYHINFSGIKETGHHNLYQKGHIEGIYNIPQIVESAIYLTTEKNEKTKTERKSMKTKREISNTERKARVEPTLFDFAEEEKKQNVGIGKHNLIEIVFAEKADWKNENGEEICFFIKKDETLNAITTGLSKDYDGNGHYNNADESFHGFLVAKEHRIIPLLQALAHPNEKNINLLTDDECHEFNLIMRNINPEYKKAYEDKLEQERRDREANAGKNATSFVLNKLNDAGIEVVTDKKEFDKRLDEINGTDVFQAMTEKFVEKEINSVPRATKEIRETLEKVLEKTAVPFTEVAYTRENYLQIFRDGIVQTPVETVKLGANQFVRLCPPDRNNLMGAIYETMTKPSIVLEKETFDEKSEKFKPVHVYGKSFINEKDKHKRAVESIVIFRDGENIAASLHNRDISKFVDQIKTADDIIYIDNEVSRVAAFSSRTGDSHVVKETQEFLSSSGRKSLPSWNKFYNPEDVLSIKKLIDDGKVQGGTVEINENNFDKYFNIFNQNLKYKDNRNKIASDLFNYHVKPENKAEMKEWLENQEYEIKEKNRQFKISNGKVYGFTDGEKIYLNPDFLNSNVAVHEYTHLWDEYTHHTNPELWKKGMSILKDTKLFSEVKSDPNYADIADNDNLVLSEVHARICGKLSQEYLERIAKDDGEIKSISATEWNGEVAEYVEKELFPGKDIFYQRYHTRGIEENELDGDAIEHFLATPMIDLAKGLSIKNRDFETRFINRDFTEVFERLSDINFKTNIYKTKRKEEQKKEYEKLWNELFPDGEPKEIQEKRNGWQQRIKEYEDELKLPETLKKAKAQAKKMSVETIKERLEQYEKDMYGLFPKTVAEASEINEAKFKDDILNMLGKHHNSYANWLNWDDVFVWNTTEPVSSIATDIRISVLENELKSREISIEKENKIMTKKEIIDYYVTQKNDRKTGRFNSYESMMIDWKDFIENLYMSDVITEKQRDSLEQPCTEKGFEKFNERFESNANQKVIKELINDYEETSEIDNSQEKPELKTYHKLKEEDVKNLKIISDEEFSDIVDSIILNDYKNVPNAIRLPNLNAELSEKLGLEKDSAFILKKSATHIRPDRKNGYGQAFDTEEYREIPEIIRNAKFAVVDNYFQNFQIVFDDKNNDEKINKLVFNKDELGNYLVTIGKVERESSFSEERNSVVAVGVAPTIQTLRTRASSTALRASTTTATENIQQETKTVNFTVSRENVLSPDIKGFKNIADRICEIDDLALKRIGATNGTTKIRTDGKAAEEYFSFLKSHIDSVSSLSISVFNELENRNYHTASAALSIMGFFGKEHQEYFAQRSEMNKENPDNYDFPPEIVPKEIVLADRKKEPKRREISIENKDRNMEKDNQNVNDLEEATRAYNKSLIERESMLKKNISAITRLANANTHDVDRYNSLHDYVAQLSKWNTDHEKTEDPSRYDMASAGRDYAKIANSKTARKIMEDYRNGLFKANENGILEKIKVADQIEAELSQWYETVDWEDPVESAEAFQNGTQEQVAYIRKRQNETIDNGIEQLQANYGLSENVIENSYDAEQNSNPDYLDENGNPHWYSDEENEIDEGISDEELIQIYKQKYTDLSLSISEDIRKELENVFSEIDNYLDKGTVPEESRFTLPKTPSYLQELGSDETVISLPVSVIKKAKETHGLSNEEIKNSLLRFYDPVVVFDTDKTKSENKQNSKLILTDEFAGNKPIALAVNTNANIRISNGKQSLEVQDIRSIHDRTLISKNGTDLIKQWTENGLCRYVDDKKITDWSNVSRVYFPIDELQSDKNNILIKSEFVNSEIDNAVVGVGVAPTISALRFPEEQPATRLRPSPTTINRNIQQETETVKQEIKENKIMEKELDQTDLSSYIERFENETQGRSNEIQLQKAIELALEKNTIPLKEVELNRKNWNKFFPKGTVETPIGTVKLGENQFEKLQKEDRNNLLAAMYETLSNPAIVLEKETLDKNSGDFKPVNVYGKSFVREDPNHKKIVESVVIFKDGDEISIGTHNKELGRFSRQIKTADQIIFADSEISRVASLILKNGGSHVQLKDINTQALNPNLHQNSEFVKQEISKSSEQIATELVLEKLKVANINVITDENEMQSILDAGIEVQKMAAHYGTSQNIENYESFNGYGVYVLSINKENAKNLGLKIAAKKYGDSFYINDQPLQEFLQERNFSPYWQSVVNQISNPSQEELLYQIVNSNVKENATLVKEQNQLITLCNLNLINYKREQTYLYSVEIPDNDNTNYLYYDKTVGLEHANRINDELKKIGSNWKVSRNDTGKNIYFNMLSNKVFNSQKQASEFLRKIGYVGMEMDNSNYIIFDDREMNINNRVQYMMTENGEVYGFAYNGQIYADKNLMNSNVLAHEYTHLWDNYTKNANPNLWEQGKNIFKQTNLWTEVVNDPSYQNIKNNEDEILSECHARICGKFAQQVFERIAAENGENAKNAVIDWDNEVNNFIAKEFGFSPELGSENYISESIKAESMKMFLATPMKDLMAGKGFEKQIEKGNELEQDDYIHSEEFISKFGDWEKANRLEKLRNAESIIKDGKITLSNSDITETVESLIYNEDRKGLQSLEKEIGKNILGAYINQDTGLTINVSNRNVTEISNHHYLFKEHIQSLTYVPEIIDKAILIGEVENEDKQKHPNIEKYLYFGTGIKIDDIDYTCKSVIGIDKNNNCYYDQSLSTIEKGRLVDYIFINEKVGNLSPLITQRETDLESNNLPYVYYDKRLINICQVPQMPYLEMVNGKWQPKEEAIQAVKEGKLFIEKNGQDYTMHDDESTVENISELQSALKDALKEVAVPLEKIEFTRDNYNKLFPEGYITTPIESVKMGANQFEKLEEKERQNLLLAVYDTLKNPDLIINEQKENVFGENEDNHIYAKSFLIDDKVHGVQSVVVSIDGENVSISTHERSINNIVNKIKKPDQLLYAAAKVRLLVEQHTKEELPQLMVNPIRENEYVVSPQSNIQQETESVKQQEIHQEKTENISNLPEVSVKSYVSDEKFTGQNPTRAQKLRRELVENGTIKLEDDVFLVSEAQIKSAGCNVKQGTTSVMILCPPDKKNPGFHEETYFHISAVDNIKRLEKFYNKNQSNENENLPIEDNKIIYGKTKIPPFTVLINDKLQNIDNAVVLGYDKKSQSYLIQNGDEKISLKNKTMQSILKNELNQNVQNNNQSEIKIAQEKAIVFEDKERNIHGTVIPEFSMITSHGFENFKDCVITKYNQTDNSYTLSNDEKSIVVTKETLVELTTKERFEKKYDENSKIYDKMLQSQYNDYFKIRSNTSYNFIHNFSVYCRKGANSPCDALELAKDIIDKMPNAEKRKTQKILDSLCKNGETINEVLVNAYHDAIKDFPLNEEYIKKYHPETKIARPFYDTVFEKGEYIDNNVALKKGDKNLNLKIGDTISNLNISVDKIFGYGKEKVHFDQLKIISSSKENDLITLMDKNKSFIELPRNKILTIYAQRQEKLNKQEQKNQKRNAIEISR